MCGGQGGCGGGGKKIMRGTDTNETEKIKPSRKKCNLEKRMTDVDTIEEQPLRRKGLKRTDE